MLEMRSDVRSKRLCTIDILYALYLVPSYVLIVTFMHKYGSPHIYPEPPAYPKITGAVPAAIYRYFL